MVTRGISEFIVRLDYIRGELKEKFSRAHQVLQDREAALLKQLFEIELTYRDRYARIAENRQTLLFAKENLENSMNGNGDQDILDSILSPLDERLKALGERDGERKGVEFQWDGELENILGDVGRILTDVVIQAPAPGPVPIYKNKIKPVLVACKFNQKVANGKFNYPTAIAINPKSGDIYICDLLNHRIQVFSKDCEFRFQFNQHMKNPAGIEIHEDKVYATQHGNHNLCIYSVNGEFRQIVGEKGCKELQFNQPHGIAIHAERYRIYVCEQENNRVQVLKLNDLAFHSFISDLARPKDVKIRNKNIFVMDDGSPCIHVYNEYHVPLRQLITYGEDAIQVVRSYHFTIDEGFNFLFTDDSGCVSIFTKEGKFVHKIGKKGEGLGELTSPRGIAIDAEGRVIVASRNPKHCIQFF